MEFQPLVLEQAQVYNRYWEMCPEKTADYTFVNLWTWGDYYKFEIKEEANLFWIKTGDGFLRTPIGDWEKVDFTQIEFLKKPVTLYRVPEKLKDILESQFASRVHSEEDRDNAEYLYNQEDLALLKGNKFHKKKNHINSFNKNYAATYLSFTGASITDAVYEDIVKLQNIWCTWHGCKDDEALYAEYSGIQRILQNFMAFPQLIGGALYVENNIIAFSLGERLDDKTLVVHFEKAHPEYRGAYQAINQTFAKEAGEGFQLINREQDLGDIGLRQAKLSYQPVGFLNKYTVNLS